MAVDPDDVEAQLKQADLLMKDGRKADAQRILEEVLTAYPSHEGAHGDAVAIYLLGRMYGEAQSVFGRYKLATGEDLTSDFSLEEIERQERAVKSEEERYLRSGARLFRRIPLRDRLRRYQSPGDDAFLSFSPVREIEIHDDRLILRRGRREEAYTWAELSNARIVKKRVHDRQSDYIRHIFRVETPGGTRAFSVTPAYPVFENWEMLVAELKKYVPVEETLVGSIPDRTVALVIAVLVVAAYFYVSCHQLR